MYAKYKDLCGQVTEGLLTLQSETCFKAVSNTFYERYFLTLVENDF